MDDFKKKPETEMMDKEIIFSKSVKAGKRIYYLDVKKNRKDEMFLTITESKKIVSDEEGENVQIKFEKHKIFLYQEDFGKFLSGLNDTISYINQNQEPFCYENDKSKSEDNLEKKDARVEEESSKPKSDLSSEIKLDIDF